MSRLNALLLLGVLTVGILIGLVLGGVLDAGGKDRTGVPVREDHPRDQPESGVSVEQRGWPAGETRVHDAPSVRSPAAPAESEELFSPALLQYFADEISAAWMKSRNEAIPEADLEQAIAECKGKLLSLPGVIGRQAAESRTKQEHADAAKRDGDAAGILAALSEGKALLPWDDVGSDVLGKMVGRRGAGRLVHGPTFSDSRDPVEAKLTIEFPVGIYTLDERRLAGSGAFPPDVEILGAGMNATLLTISDISPQTEVKRFTIRNITLWTNNDGLFDARRAAIGIDFENVRIIGFDAAHGGAYIVSTPSAGSVVRMRSCEILGGFGRNPSRGTLYRSGPAVALFDSCRLERFELGLTDLGASSRVLFRGCLFSKMPDPTAAPPAGVRFAGCASDDPWTQQQMATDATRREVTELFPNFQR